MQIILKWWKFAFGMHNCTTRFNKGLRSNLYFWRDHKGKEIDCLADHGQNFTAIEIKAGRTYTESYFGNLRFWNKLSGNTEESSFVIYGGEKSFNTKYGHLLSWKNLVEIPKIPYRYIS